MRNLRAISIHAPTWGATLICPLLFLCSHFNPRSHMGSDFLGRHNGYYLLFQSTLPHGERLLRLVSGLLGRHFNPRSHMGSDSVSGFHFSPARIYFNPRSHMGSDRHTIFLQTRAADFNPRSHMGSDDMLRP